MKPINYVLFALVSILGITWSCKQMQGSKYMEISSLQGENLKIDISEIQDLRNAIKGEILTKADPAYDRAREIWNLARHNLQPAMIVKCADTEDVALAVKFAAKFRLLLSVKGGGHNSSGFALNDNGMVVDLSGMKKITVDPQGRTATVGPGVLWGELDRHTQRYGLATTGAIISQVGVGGFTLGGGLGWLHRSLGAACDNLISAEIVLADGRILTLNEQQNQELFWAIRGGGGNFGIVTAFEFKLHEVGPQILAGLVFYPFRDLDKILKFYQEHIEKIPDQLGSWILLRKAPPIDALSKEVHGKPVVMIALTYNGNISEGQRYCAPLRKITTPLVDLVKTRSYQEWQSSLDGAWGNGYHNLWMGHYFNEINDITIEHLAKYVPMGSPYSDIKIQHLEGKFGQVPDSATAFGPRNARFGMVIQTRWKNQEQTPAQEQWAKRVHNALKAASTGKVYLNFMDLEGKERVKDAYSTSTYERLRNIKQKYDPGNLFRRNQNITPE